MGEKRVESAEEMNNASTGGGGGGVEKKGCGNVCGQGRG